MVASEIELSVVVPAFNEQDNLGPLVEAVRSTLDAFASWELLLIDDGSRDDTARVAAELVAEDARIRLIRLARNYGQTAAMQTGFEQARGRIVVTMDGDLQNDPRDIPLLVAKLQEGYDLVAGYRQKRQDKLITRRVPSQVANRIVRWITGVHIRDNGCSLKAYRRELLDRIHLYSDMHRFIPAVAVATAGARIAEIPVRHHPRRYGQSKYGLSRIAKVLSDLLLIAVIRSFREKPFAMFAAGAILAMMIGSMFTGALASCTVLPFSSSVPCSLNLPIVSGVALLWLALASYLLMLGLIAEILLRESFSSHPPPVPVVREREVHLHHDKPSSPTNSWFLA